MSPLGRDLVAELARGGRPLIGTWVKIPAVETVELLGHAGFDFIVADLEHSPLTLESAYRAIAVAQSGGMAALARVPDDGGSDAQRLLDAGADGILVPRVTSVAQASAALRRLVFAPMGERGMGRTSRAGRWGLAPLEEYLVRGMDQVLRCLQLEDLGALRDAPGMLGLEHLGALFVGMGDLTLSSGLDPGDPALAGLVRAVLDEARGASIPVGTAVGDASGVRRAVEAGYSFVMVANDAGIFGQAAADLVAACR